MTEDATVAADEQARAAARLRGATEALNVLQRRSPAEQQRGSRFALCLLATNVTAADWTAAGLPPAAVPDQPAACPVPLGHKAALRLARAALALYCAELPGNERPRHWDQLADFFERHFTAADPELVQLRERAASAHADAGDTAPEIIAELLAAVDFHQARDGGDGYLTTLARANLAMAYRQRRAESDLAKAALLAEAEARYRTGTYGPEHPVTLVARSLLTLSLLLQAEASDDESERRRLAGRALHEIEEVRVVRDRLFGVTAPNSTSIRRYEARALLLLGQPQKACNYLEYTLTFEDAHNGGRQTQSIGETHYQLARARRACGDLTRALDHAQRASQIFQSHNPAGRAARNARRLIQELAAA